MINKQLINLSSPASSGGGTGNQEEGLILHLDANDVDSYDGDGTVWYDIKDHEYTPTTNVSEHFNTVLYTGSGDTTNGQSITGVGFQPDLVWIKSRNTNYNNVLYDSVRGVNSAISSNLTDSARVNENRFESFDLDGFSIEADNAGDLWKIDRDSQPFVAWCFKAGGAAVPNTNGDITSQVNVNNDLGFSIVSYTGNNSFGQTVGHGLDVQPQMVIYKNLSNARNWRTYVEPLGATKYINLDENAAAGTYGSFNNTAPTSTVFSTTSSVADRATNFNGDNYIAYCFASKRGVSKVGSYTGNGSTGQLITTGFQPRYLLVKCSSGSLYYHDWYIFDNKRGDAYLQANVSDAEEQSPTYNPTFESTGFRWEPGDNSGGWNGSGFTYIYYAIAENTNETSLIPDTDLELHLDAASFPEKGEAGYSNTPSTWTDSSSNSNNGTISGGALFDSELGNWLYLDGGDDKIDVGNISAFNTTNSFTLEFWENRDDTNENCFVAKGTYPSDAGWFFTYNPTYGYYFFDYGTSSYLRAGSSYSAGQWRHVVLTWNASTKTPSLFVNGESVSATVVIGTGTGTNNTVSMQIGNGVGRAGAQAGFDGKLGQVRGYSSVLSQDQIRQNYNFTKPSYPNGYNFTNNNSVSFLPASDTFDFDGNNDYFETTTNAVLKSESTVIIWCTHDGGNSQMLFSNGVNNDTGIFVGISSTGDIRIGQTTAASDFTFDSTMKHYAFVFSDSDGYVKVYKNGVLQTTRNHSQGGFFYPSQQSWFSNFRIGRQLHTYGEYWDGKVGSLKIYDKTLSVTEILADYNDTKSKWE